MPIEKIIKERTAYYDMNGSVPLEVKQKDVDYIRESGVILNQEREKAIAGKKTPEELRKSMAVFKYGENGRVSDYVKEHLRKQKRSHMFVILKKETQKSAELKTSKKSTMLKKLYYGEK